MSLIDSGTYYIVGQAGTYLALTGGTLGVNLTTWHYSGGSEQQWIIAPASGTNVYTIQNVKYNTYISYSTAENPGAFVAQSTTPYDWFVEDYDNTNYGGSGLAFSNTGNFYLAWNDTDGYQSDNNPVIMYGCCDVWNLTAVSASGTSSTGSAGSSSTSSPAASTTSGTSSSSGSSNTHHVAIIVGPVVGVVGGLLVIIGGYFLWTKWLRERFRSRLRIY